MSKKKKNIFQKIGKAVKDTADDVVDTVEDTAKDVSKAVVNISRDALDATEKGFNAAIKESEKFLNDVQKAALKAAALDVIKKHDKEIKALAKAAQAIAEDPKLKKALETVVNKATSAKFDADFTTALRSIMLGPSFILLTQETSATKFPTISLGLSGGGGYVAGVEASGGMGITHPGIQNGQICGYVDAGGALGTFGGSAAVTLGIETSRPEGIGGGYIGVSVEAKVLVGAGLEISFNMPDFTLGGIAVAAGVGMSASAALTGGYTHVVEKANYKTPW